MTTPPPSRRPGVSPWADTTLDDVLKLIEGDQALPPHRRHDMASAIRRLARALGRQAAEISAHPGDLGRKIQALNPAMAGLTPVRLRNIASLTRAALKVAGLAKVPGRYAVPLAPAWRELYAYLNAPALRIGLSRFAHYCSDHDIAPAQVDDQVMRDYLDALENGALVRQPRTVHRSACVCWNKAAVQIPAWPKQQLAVPNYLETYSLPWDAFPSSLKAEVKAYLHRLAGEDLLEEVDFRPLKASSLAVHDYRVRQFCSALVRRGRDPATLRSLADVVQVDTVKDGLRFYLERSGNKPTRQIHAVAGTLKAIARHWVGVDADQLKQLKAVCQRLDLGRGGMTHKNRDLLRQFDNPDNVLALINLPKRLLVEARRRQHPTRSDALRVMTAAAIEILLMVPLRMHNLLALDLDRHLLRSGSPKRSRIHLFIAGSETKNGFDIHAELPAETVDLLDTYLAEFRPFLLDQPSPWVFPGAHGNHRSHGGLAYQIQQTIARKTGLRVNPHLFRHIAAQIHLTAFPGDYGTVRLVEGHKSMETTVRHYAGAETVAAIRRYDEHVLKLRERQPVLARRPRTRSLERAS